MADSKLVGPVLPASFRVGEWCVERSLNQLRRGDEVVRLEPKSIDVLVSLAARPGDVVSRDELLAAAWPGVVVSDDALTQAVIKLRKALGDTSREPRYIETISKRGYRLVADVVLGDASAVARVDGPSAPAGRGFARPRRAWLGLALLTLSAIALAFALSMGDGLDSGPSDEDMAVLQRGLDQLAGQPALAVRPFEAIGADSQTSVVAAGLTSDLITDLSGISGLTVLGGSRPVRQGSAANSALAEHYVVSGTVQRDGDKLRVNVQLLDLRIDRQLWSERFERGSGDLFAVQDDIRKRLLAVLPVKVDEAERVRSAVRYTRNLEAYELFHRGLLAMGAREREQNETARAFYRRAIALDPGFARAYAGLAMTYAQDYRQQWADDGRAALSRAIETAQAALEMDPASAEALWVLAFAREHERRHDEAARLLREVVRRSPSYADAYFLMGLLLMETGRPRDALSWMRAASRLVPNPGHIHYFGLGQAYFFLGEHEAARSNLEAALARNPAHAEAHLYLAATLMELGLTGQAAWHAGELKALRPDFRAHAWLERHPVVDRMQRDRLSATLDRLGLG